MWGSPGRRRSTLRLLALALGLLASPHGLPSSAGAAESDPEPIESTYASPGPWPVERSSVADGFGRSFVVRRPSHLGAGGFEHPIVTWGNGSYIPESSYAAMLDHLASWGFVVIATTSIWTGDGDEILAGLTYLTDQTAQPGSVFFDKLATARVGAMGHSQGAYGALSATSKSQGRISTVVPINLPDPVWLSPEHATDLTRVLQPVFYVGGSDDWLSTPAGLLTYLRQIPGSSVIGLRVGASHETILAPADRYLGYVTAWLMYQLRDDRIAAQAFEGPAAEIGGNPSWQLQQRRGTPGPR